MKSLGRKPEGARLERIKASPLWAGERFRNVHPIIEGLRDPNASMPTLGEFLCGGDRRTPRGPLPSMNPLEAWARPVASGLRATWLGHSTVLIEIDGLRVLTDPVWAADLGRLEMALIVEQQVVHRPEFPLAGRGFARERGAQGVRVGLFEREMPVGDPHAADEALEQHLHHRRRLQAVRAFEIAVFDNGHGRMLRTQHVIGVAHGNGELKR